MRLFPFFCLLIFFLFQVLLQKQSLQQKKKVLSYQNQSKKNYKSRYDTVFSYLDVLNGYYEKALDVKTEEGKDFISFDDFTDLYYTYGIKIGIVSYTDAWNKFDTISEFTASVTSSPRISSNSRRYSSPSSNDADYILNSTTYSYTPAKVFKRAPVNNFHLMEFVRPGDIVYETNTKFWDCGHNAIIVSLNQPSAYGPFYQTIEAVGGGVQYGFLDDQRIIDFGVKLLRSLAAENQVNTAISFASRQLGKPYSLDITRANTSINSSQWYCSELVWAAYNYAQIDICQIKGIPLGHFGNIGGPLPSTIYSSDNVISIPLISRFLKLSIVSKDGNTWKIRIKNRSSNRLMSVQYNAKMCKENDGRDWENLKDLKTFVLFPYCYQDVDISENWFADSIVCSNDTSGYHYITYGNRLSATTKELLAKNSVKQIKTSE